MFNKFMTPESTEVLNSTRVHNELFTFSGWKRKKKRSFFFFFLFENTTLSSCVRCLLKRIDRSEAQTHKCHPLSSFITAVSNSSSALLTVSQPSWMTVSIHVPLFGSHASEEIMKAIAQMRLICSIYLLFFFFQRLVRSKS